MSDVMRPRQTIFVFNGDNKRKDYASMRRGETRAREKATSFLCFARDNLQSGDHFIFTSNGAARCFCGGREGRGGGVRGA